MSIFWKKHGVRLHKSEKACVGYTLISSHTFNDAWLLDMEGNYVHRWTFPAKARNHGVLLPNGNLLYAMAAPLPADENDVSVPRVGSWGTGGGLLEMSWEGDLVWKHVDKCQSHSFYRMRSGNTIYPRVIRVPDDIARKVRSGIPGTEDRGMIWTDGLREVTPDNKIVWEWSALDHLDPDIHIMCPLSLRADWTHMNSVEELPDGNILTNFRNISSTWIIDKATGKVIWDWGRGEVSHQHAPTMLDNGNILMFDNGMHRQNDSLMCYSRAVEVNPKTNKIEWEYMADPPQSFYSSLLANCQRLPNGNTLICEAMRGRVFEVTTDGEIVWEYMNPFYRPHTSPFQGQRSLLGWQTSNQIFRAYRYTPDYAGLKGKNLSPENLKWVNQLYGSGVS